MRTSSAKLVAPYAVLSVISVLEWRDGLQLFHSLVCCDVARHVVATELYNPRVIVINGVASLMDGSSGNS